MFCFVSEAQRDPEKYRFEIELEFVQCLANPSYLNCEGDYTVELTTDNEHNIPTKDTLLGTP